MTSRSKKREERIALAKQVIDYLNEKADRKFRHESRGTLKLFTAEWSHEYGLSQYKGVIDYLVLRWKDDERMAAYLRPATLFGPEKFPEYLDEARARIKAERKRGRLSPFKNYRPVESADVKERVPFEKYDPHS